MKKLNRLIMFGMLITIFGNCSPMHSGRSQGESVIRISKFHSQKNDSDSIIILPEMAWYRDSVGITQICRMMWYENDTASRLSIETVGYRFVDLRKQWAYEYHNFTDTAAIIKKYGGADTAMNIGGWNFSNRVPLAVDTFQYLSDSIIKNIVYKRCRLNYTFNQTSFEAMGMLRCDKKNTQFSFDTAITHKVGCPLTYMSVYPAGNPTARLEKEIQFMREGFPDSVRRVFAAWKRNVEKHPVE